MWRLGSKAGSPQCKEGRCLEAPSRGVCDSSWSMGSAASRGFGHPPTDAAGPTSPCQDIPERGPAKHRPLLSWVMEQCHRDLSSGTSTQSPPSLQELESGCVQVFGSRCSRTHTAGFEILHSRAELCQASISPPPLLEEVLAGSSLSPSAQGLSCGWCFLPSLGGRELLPNPDEKGLADPLHQGRNSAKHPKGQL